jgi:hypothetical protein
VAAERFTIEPTPEFVRVCEERGLEPERMATLLCNDFARRPPRRMLIITRLLPQAALAAQLASQVADQLN